MSSPKSKRQPPARDFDKYVATFQSDPLNKSVGLNSVNPNKWKQFGPILSSSNGYITFIQESLTESIVIPGRNSDIIPLGFGFNFNGVTYNDFIASPHGWMSLLDPSNYPSAASIDTAYIDRMIISGSSSFDNAAIKQAFQYNDLLLAPWFDRQLTTHRDIDSYIEYFSGSNTSVASQKERFLFGRANSKDYSFKEHNFGMKYALIDDSVDGKALVIRWSTMGYKYRGKKLSYETAIYESGKIEFNYAPLANYLTDYTLLPLTANPVNVWKLDESTGATVNDAMNATNLIYKTPANMRPSAGIIGTASFFSGSTNTVIYANDTAFANYAVTDSFSFSAWFKGALNDASIKFILSRKNQDFSRGYSLGLWGGTIVLTLSDTYDSNTLQVRSVPNAYSDNNWHHAVVTYNGNASASGIKIYIDGQQISTTTTYSTLTVSSNIQAGATRDFLIGAYGVQNANNQHFTGSIDDVARWNAVITSNDVNTIYENGLAGISVADITPIGNSTTSYATCGIFASGSSTWNYRDFAPLLGVMSASRKISDFGGGLYTGSYFDINTETSVTASYAVNIGINHWPKHGGKITFSAPKLRRQLIRTDLLADDSKQYFDQSGFDDRRIINYITQSNVDASTVLPLSLIVAPSYPGVHLKQNLISSGGIRLPNRKIIFAGHDSYIADETHLFKKTTPFSEDSPSQGRLTDSFFLTGSISAFGENTNSFARSIENKRQFKLVFNVNNKTKMFTSASSLYYYNVAANQWNIPTRSLDDHVTSSFKKFSVPTAGAGGSCNGSFYLEDKIGFDSQGNCIISGNLNIFRSTTGNEENNQSTAEIGNLFNLKDHTQILEPEYAKSIQRNSNYLASDDECFTLPIIDPFLVEKAVIEIPFCMGDGWFDDRTSFLFASASNYAYTASNGDITKLSPLNWLEEGGPAITVAMYCQRNYGTGSVRDLVFKTTFSHADDKQNLVKLTYANSGSASDLTHIVTLTGNDNNRNIMSDYVPYQLNNSKKVFTGSVLVKADASITNCANVGIFRIFRQSSYINTGSLLVDFENFLNTEYVSIGNKTNPLTNLTYLLGFDTFGRSMSGFGAGSGGEFITSQDVLYNQSILNPFYITGSSYRQTVSASLDSQFNLLGTGSYIYCTSKLSLGKQKQSPYLAYPEDKFILSVSKTRPAYNRADIRISAASLSTGKITTLVSSSYFNDVSDPEGHEVYLNTGSIKLTLYGSNVKLGGEVQ